MTTALREHLEEVPIQYPKTHLRETFYITLEPEVRLQLTALLPKLLTQLYKAGRHMGEDTKVRLIYESLSRLMVYDHTEYPENKGMLRYTYAGGITTGKAVCMGVAELFTMVASAMALPVETVVGYGGDPARSGGLHAWNIVWLHDIPYHVDLTWDLSDNVRIRGGFKYYLKSDAYMAANDHTWLPERYPHCPRCMPEREIPKIPPQAVALLCAEFENIRRAIQAGK